MAGQISEGGVSEGIGLRGQIPEKRAKGVNF